MLSEDLGLIFYQTMDVLNELTCALIAEKIHHSCVPFTPL